MRGIPNFCWESPDISYHWDALCTSIRFCTTVERNLSRIPQKIVNKGRNIIYSHQQSTDLLPL